MATPAGLGPRGTAVASRASTGALSDLALNQGSRRRGAPAPEPEPIVSGYPVERGDPRNAPFSGPYRAGRTRRPTLPARSEPALRSAPARSSGARGLLLPSPLAIANRHGRGALGRPRPRPIPTPRRLAVLWVHVALAVDAGQRRTIPDCSAIYGLRATETASRPRCARSCGGSCGAARTTALAAPSGACSR